MQAHPSIHTCMQPSITFVVSRKYKDEKKKKNSNSSPMQRPIVCTHDAEIQPYYMHEKKNFPENAYQTEPKTKKNECRYSLMMLVAVSRRSITHIKRKKGKEKRKRNIHLLQITH